MSDAIIKVENLSKRFIIDHEGPSQYSTFRDVISYNAKKLLPKGRKASLAKHSKEEFWALKDVNFEVRRGERVGILGKNGAGKSTLLKILSRITEPTAGTIRLKGRIASLLEVGTGFHPELTGRENIFLNGAILGMTSTEIRKKFDEIVDFSGVERFLDTPVKRFSSGMYVRLAFAVAAHLEPEILVIDEVLAVGDMEFQKKCLGKMEDVSAREGRTVLFVSHNLQAISTLTNKVILLNAGTKVFDGDTGPGIQKYLEYMSSRELIYQKAPSDKKPLVTKVEVKTTDINNVQVFGESFRIDFEITTPQPIPSAVFSFQIVNSAQVKVQHVLIKDSETPIMREAGRHVLSCYFPRLRLFPDKYHLIIHLSDHISRTKYETIEGICPFEVQIRGEVREYYWKTNEAAYVDDTEWIINP
jgi:lipopolysaccharide transport system ATP-binding protein